jgi:hypothetical protein
MLQSNDEILRIADEYSRGFAPTDLIHSETNAEAMLRYALEKYGLVSISYLIEAEQTLGVQLERKPQPKQPTEAEKAAKLEAKMRKDYADSIAPQTTLGQQKTNQDRADENKKIANEKEFKQLNSLIEFEISNYTVGHASGVTDYARTEYGRESLRKVRDSHDRSTILNAKAALSAVRAAKAKM